MLPIFLSLVIATRNQAKQLPEVLSTVSETLQKLVSDYEIIVVDNGSTDSSIDRLKTLTGVDGLPNLQIYALTKEVDTDTAAWVGMENSLGDFVAILDPRVDDIYFLSKMLDEAVQGADVVFAHNSLRSSQDFVYRCLHTLFNLLYQLFNGINLAEEAPQYRVLSKQVVNFILRHSQPWIAYRHLPATAGFATSKLSYRFVPRHKPNKNLGDAIDRGLQLLVSTTRGPMRMVSSLALFGAVANVVYSCYVIAIALLKENVAEGWVSLSLQQSGMFLLISLVLLVLGEYLLQATSLANGDPVYHIAQELTSARLLHREKLNVEEINSRIKQIRA
jgi:hypothetical protein